MKRDAENPASDDALDQSIREALRVEVDEQQLAGLERFWRVQSQREKWRRNAHRAMVAAAAAIVLVAASLLIRHRDQQREIAQVIQDIPSKVVDSDSGKPPRKEVLEPVAPAPNAGREPTAYEQLVFAARSGIAVQKTPTAVTIDEVIRRVASDADADPVAVVTSSGLKQSVAELLLLPRLPNATANDQHAILRLLAECGSQKSVPVLLRLARTEPLRMEALGTLEQIVGIEGLAQTVGKSTDANVRSALILRLLVADSQSGLIGYLSLVRNEATRADALSVAKDAPNIPVPQLITLLDFGDEPVRMAAAITLGHVNGPETTRLLINRVTEQPANSPEAWIALMACRGEMARDFLDYATQRPQFLGHYNYARMRLAQMIP